MRWLLLYTHAYDITLNRILSLKRNCDSTIKVLQKIEHFENVLTFIEKRIKLIKYDN